MEICNRRLVVAMAASAASEIRDFEDTDANDGALKSIIQEHSYGKF